MSPAYALMSITAFAGGIFMRRGRRCLWGLTAIILGLVILLSLVLPSSFWWFTLAAALIGFGLWYIRCC